LKKGRYMNDAFVVSAVRLPIGRFGGSLKEVSDWDLGTIVIAEAVKRAGLRGDQIDLGRAIFPPILREP
jgi:acetyl-CoA C-acetyltransferase